MPSSSGVDLSGLKPERVCIIKPSSLGDVVHALPVLSALRSLWPDAHLAWVINRGLRELVDGHPDLDEVIPFDRSRARLRPGGIAMMAGFLAGLRRRRFDLAIDLQGLLRSGIMTAATGAPIRVGLEEAREGARLFYTHRVASRPGAPHAVDVMLSIAEALGADIQEPKFTVPISESDRLWATQTLMTVPTPRLVLNPGARWLTKRWPAEHFAAVARQAVRERGTGLIIVGAPEDRPLADALLQSLDGLPALDLCGRTSLSTLAAVADLADVFLSNDTGPLHLAAAVGTRVVGVYTCTSPLKTGPYGSSAISVRSCVWCAPSFVKNCSRLECMTELGPDRVWPLVLSQFDAAEQSRSSPSAA